MASSASDGRQRSAALQQWQYDVFLNHRGPDVKDTFVAHLNDALCAAGFHPFLDAKSLIKGKHPYNSINEALSGVGVHVAIFSKGYAESKYCLDELHDMLESGKLILPVFYGVEVEHLCRPYDGPFAAGLRKHKKRGRHQDVERWETALAKVADLQGFRLAEFNGDEAQLKRRIVLAVQRALPARRLQQVAPHRVGLEESLKVVIKKLNLTGDSVRIIGVFGMGGIGKTTLVREVYNHFAMEKRFEEQSFLKDVRSITDPLDLQKQLVYDLLQEDLQSSEKFSYRFDRFMGRKVLIVVDDIDHRSQFDVLIPHIDKLARGSRILVTSRDQNVLTNIMRGDGHLTAMHEVELMSPHDSYRLFNWHAFYNEKASDGFQDLARKVADACCRLPLALEVIGAFLFDKKRPEDRDCWHQATETLRANGDILNKLKISYDGLSSDESRLMFTDIACFLIGKDEQMAMQIFESCISYTGPQVSFHALMDKSLVTLDSDRRIRMHDLLRDMGRNVVTKQSQIEGQRSHLWDPAMAERVLRKNQGTDTVRGLSVAGAKDGAAWKAETYTRMSELHFLILDHCQVKGDFSTWSKELRWLQWWSLPLLELPPTLSLLNLSVLDLTGTKSFPCKELRMLILKDCTALKELPQTIGKLSRLKNLDVQGCSTLKALPDSMGELVELTQLNLSNCTTLKMLPDTICLLSKLEKLWLINCTELEFLPTEFGKLQRLDEFWADATSLSTLPHSFSQLSNLEDLHLRKCENIQELPSMSGLFPCKELRMLILKDCTALKELPQTIGKLSRLKNLDVQGCSTLKALPDSMGELVELTQLNLSNCTTLKMLPDTICLLSKLEKLWLINCTKLKFLPTEFGKLQRLDEFWADATSLSTLPHSFSQLSNLEDLHLHKCENIQELPSMSGLFPCKELRMLILKDCTALKELPQTIGKLSRLKNLDVQVCSTLKALPDSVGELVELTQLNLSNCTTLKMLPDTICLLSKLEKLWLINCTKLEFLPTEFGKLQRLDEFWADATSLSTLPHSFSQLSNLEDLHLHKCENIQELPSMSGLVNLKLFHMGHIGVQTLPEDFGHLQNLVELHLYGCKNLQTLPQSFGSLQLQRLQMNDNPKLEMLPEGFGRPKKRKHDSLFIKLKSSSGRFKEPNVDVPSTSLELGTKSLKNVENTISAQSSDSVLINQLQCDYLFHKLRESLNDAKACIDGLSPQDIQRSCCILESLAQTWKEGEILVRDCCDAQWIRVAMILANAKEHFTSLIFKLRLYMQLFQSIFKEGATKEFLIKLQDRKWSDDVKDEEFPIIDEKALEDQQWLLSRLMEVGSIDSENLIKRLNHPGKIDAWKVAHKSIQRVPHGQIGKGASAIVHKVEWLGKYFAEKCFFGLEGEHFQKEASLLAGLSHPNILPLFCLVTTANSCSLVTELMDGDLHGLMRKRLDNHEIQGAPFKLLEAIDIMLQVAEGMHYLHQKKVVHRDLKSTNILVKCDEHDGHVYAKVADFGLSKTKESSCTYSNLTMDQGTTRWMAPELFGNFDQSVPIQVCQETQHPSLSNEQISRRYPFKVDIYSFGMVCYEILTGNIPFHNIIAMTELRTKIKDGLRPDLPEQCPHQLSKLIQECYHPDPATRPSFFEICLELRHIMCSLMIDCTL
ncbi:unnamed protein product [Sphagnum compactum]